MKQQIDWKTPIVIDFETYYDKEFSLKKITTEKYIRDEQFECIGVSVKIGTMPTHFYRMETGLPIIRHIVENTYPNSPVVSHSNTFDMGILGLRYDIHPNFMVDTAVLAKLCGLDRVAGGTSLAKLSEQLVKMGIVNGTKGNEVHNMLGVHAKDMSERQWQAYGEYCKLDTELCHALYMYMIDLVPKDELIMADITTKMWTKPMIDLDVDLLEDYYTQLETQKANMLDRLRDDFGFATNDELLANLRSSSKFVQLLNRLGVEAPMKWSEKQNKKIPAISKTDAEFLALLEHENEYVRLLVETKLGTASSMEQTRTLTFLDVASRGRMPVPLRYAATHTGRYGGCFIAGTKIWVLKPITTLTVYTGSHDWSPQLVKITEVGKNDLVWNGDDFVKHDGVVCNGIQPVIQYQGLVGTYGHQVFVKGREDTVDLGYAKEHNLELVLAHTPHNPVQMATVWDDLRSDGISFKSDNPIAPEIRRLQDTDITYPDGVLMPVYDIVNVGDTHRYVANGYLVHNSDKVNLQNLSKRTKEPVLRRSLRPLDGHVWVTADSAQIEARILAYVADQSDVVDIFVSGKDVYIDMATKIYGESYDSIYEQSKGANATKEGKMKRNIAKEVVLGCGYGASADKFAELMEQRGLTEQVSMASSLVGIYRSTNYNIKNFWNTCDHALAAMMTGEEFVFGGKNGDLFVASGRTKFHGVTIPSILLPNGTYIFYQNLRQEMGDDGRVNYVYDQFKGRAFQPKRIWGSALTENIVQALAFAVLKEQAIAISEHGININLNVHDEWASVVPRNQAARVCEVYYKCMKQTPDYLPDGLLDCEVDVGLNYADLKTIDISKVLRG